MTQRLTQLIRDTAGLFGRQAKATLPGVRQERAALEHDSAPTAARDPLTGLPLRALLDHRLRGALEQRDPASVVVAFIDLDGFSAVNDAHGHEVGDIVLVQVAERLEHAVRDKDTVARFGGDEFVVLLRDLEAGTQAFTVAARIEDRLALPYRVGSATVLIGASVGVAIATPGVSAPELLAAADRSMQATKGLRRGHAARAHLSESGRVRAL